MSKAMALTGTLDTIRDDTDGDQVDVAELIEALNHRGFGPLLVGPAIITIMPTGAIPGMPSICALVIIFVSVQILIGKKYPWFPKRLKNFSIEKKKFLDALEKARPCTKKIDQFIYPRFTFLIHKSLTPLIAAISILLAIAIMILGFIPFMAALPASGILFLGLGMTARDGLLFALSFLICLGSLAALPYGWSVMFGG